MKWPFRQNRIPIGVDISGRAISAVQLARVHDTWSTEAAVRLPRTRPGGPIDCDELKRFREVLYRQSFVGEEVVVAVPSNQLMTTVLTLPPRDSGAPLDQIARIELARTYEEAPNAFELAWWELPTTEHAKRTAHVMTVGYRHDKANELCDLFEQAGLRVQALDSKAWALVRAIESRSEAPSMITAVLDFEWESAQLALLYQGIVLYERVLSSCAFGELHAELTDVLEDDGTMVEYLLDQVGLEALDSNDDGDPAGLVDAQRRLAAQFDPIVKDLDESLGYVSRQYPDATFKELLLVGDHASVPGLAQHLSDALHIEVNAVPTRELVTCPDALADTLSNPALIPALGLAKFDSREAA